jgi:quercetin dioxygenase-like cupin family protein
MPGATLFIDTNTLPHEKTAGGEYAEILNAKLAGAKNVLGTLRWVQPGKEFQAEPLEKHQLLYLMEGQGRIRLEGKDYEVRKGAGVYLGPSETATIQANGDASVKLFHLVVPQIPK